MSEKTKTEPKCIVCKRDIDFVSPADLCEEHWNAWWNHEFDIEDRAVVPGTREPIPEDERI